MGLAVVGLTVAVANVLPNLLDAHPDQIGDAQWLVRLFGMGIAVRMALGAYQGVLTGHHRWGLANSIQIAGDLLKLCGMLIVLQLGYGLRALAVVNFSFVAAMSMVRCIAAYRTVPGLQVRLQHVRLSFAREMLKFGSKSFLPGGAAMVMRQMTKVFVGIAFGPAVLAVFARPMGMLRYISAMSAKLSMALTPAASSLQETNQTETLRKLTVQASRYAAFLILPIVLMLSFHGNNLLVLWMGPRYDAGLLVPILAVGHLASLSQQPAFDILKGVNAHGRVGLARLAAAGASVILMAIAVIFFDYDLTGFALLMTIPSTIANATYLPIRVCRVLHLPLRRYLIESWRGPILCCVPFAVCLISARVLVADPLMSVSYGFASGGVLLAWLYWLYAVPDGWKNRLRAQLRSRTASYSRTARPTTNTSS